MGIKNQEPATKEQYSKQYKYRQLVKAKLFIDKNFAENIDLKTMADQAHFSKFHFIRLFKNIYNITPNQYLTAIRIDAARSLLERGLTIEDVCLSVGFDSVSTFKGLFKRQTSLTPSEYKKSQLNFQSSMTNNPTIHIPHCLTKIGSIKKRAIFKTNNKF